MKELNFYLYDRRLWPENFEILRSNHIESEGYTADVWIIPGGHAFRFSVGQRSYTELAESGGKPAPDGAIERAKISDAA